MKGVRNTTCDDKVSLLYRKKSMQDDYPKFATEENFKKFVANLRGITDLDKVTKTFSDKEKVADYLIDNLPVIELKTLKSNPRDKVIDYVQSETDKINQAEGLPVFYGQHNFRKATQILQDGEKLTTKLDNLYFRQIEEVMRKANKQIKSTINSFSMTHNTYGFLTIINERADFYQPEILAGYICRELLKTNVDGTPKYSNIHQVAFIQSSYKVNDISDNILIPCHFIKNSLLVDTELSKKAEEVMIFFWSEFARFVGIRNFHIKNPRDLPATKII